VTRIFIHGLEGSSRGVKARYFQQHFPEMLTPDFTGGLPARMAQLHEILAGCRNLIMVGSSFGGLMATLFALENGPLIQRMILLAPALNFGEFVSCRGKKINLPVWLYIGREDTVTPLEQVEPLARDLFPRLHFHVAEDDHLLSQTFGAIDWISLLCKAR